MKIRYFSFDENGKIIQHTKTSLYNLKKLAREGKILDLYKEVSKADGSVYTQDYLGYKVSRSSIHNRKTEWDEKMYGLGDYYE